MNRKSPLRALTLAQACETMILYKQATGRSPNTINNYQHAFSKLQLFLPNNPALASISRQDLINFFGWLERDHVAEPDGVAPRPKRKLAAKTRLNIHSSLSALWAWAVDEGIAQANLVRAIEAPAVAPRDIQPHTQDEIEALLKACDTSRTWKTRAQTATTRPSGLRDRTILLVLLDTGMRASELVHLKMKDVDFNNNSLHILGKGVGGGKKRVVFLGRRAKAALWKYLLPRTGTTQADDLVFVNERGVGDEAEHWPMRRTGLYKLVARIGERAGVRHAHPHRMRHTYAISYLRNGGDIFTLREQLGHADWKILNHYLALSQVDRARAQETASPVDRWRL